MCFKEEMWNTIWELPEFKEGKSEISPIVRLECHQYNLRLLKIQWEIEEVNQKFPQQKMLLTNVQP